MKKVFFSLMMLLFAAGMSAQTEKGRIMLGLHNFSPLLSEANLLAPTTSFGIAFGKSKSEGFGETFEENFTTIGLNGSAHYFLIDNLSVGLNLNLFNQKTKDEDDDEAKLTLFMAGPELRYYIPMGEKSRVYLRGGASFGSAKSEFDGDEDDPINLSQFGGGAGIALFPTKNFSINFGAGYGVFQAKSEIEDFNGNTRDVSDTNSGLLIDIGFSVFFGGGE